MVMGQNGFLEIVLNDIFNQIDINFVFILDEWDYII